MEFYLSVLFFIVVVPAVITAMHHSRRYLWSLPPGPVGLPFIGNLFNLTTHEQWRTAVSWGRRYGDIIYLHVFGTPFVFLNSAGPSTDLLQKRGLHYSDRPHLTMACDLCDLKDLVPLTRSGDRFKFERKLMNEVLSSSLIDRWKPYVIKETNCLLSNLISSPDEFVLHFKRMAASLIFSTIYGYQIESYNDPYVKSAEEFMAVSSYVMTAGWIIDFIPSLRKLPFLSCHSKAAQWRAKLDDWVESPHIMFKNLPDSEMKRNSFCGILLNTSNGQQIDMETEERVKWIATSVYGAGSDTTVVTLSQFIMAMVLYPDVQDKLRAEIDSVIGLHKLPGYDDRENLPYSECVLKECLRWGTPVPLTPPHRLTRNDQYKGYSLPEGSLCVANMWAILHDEELYPNPDMFYPERFQKTQDPDLAKRMDPYNYAFGFGRRRCPGVHFANQSIWLVMVSIISCFNIAPYVGEDGREILPELKFAPGAFRHPHPFKCRITPREERLGVLQQSSML